MDVYLEPQRNYEPLFGTTDTLVDNGTNLVLTTADGTRHLFSRPADDGTGPYATGSWLETILPSGAM